KLPSFESLTEKKLFLLLLLHFASLRKVCGDLSARKRSEGKERSVISGNGLSFVFKGLGKITLTGPRPYKSTETQSKNGLNVRSSSFLALAFFRDRLDCYKPVRELCLLFSHLSKHFTFTGIPKVRLSWCTGRRTSAGASLVGKLFSGKSNLD
ncbi:T-cell-interacting, partial [Striga asiatica]